MFSILQIRSKTTRKKSIAKSNQQGLETSYKMTKGPELHHAQQSLTHLIQSSTKVNTNTQIRVHIFARMSHRSNLFMTTNTTDTSHRQGRGWHVGSAPCPPSLRWCWWSTRSLDQIGDVIVLRSRQKTLLHHPDINRYANLKLGSSQHHGSPMTNGFSHHSSKVDQQSSEALLCDDRLSTISTGKAMS